MTRIWLVTEHEMKFDSPITSQGEQTGIAAVSINAAKQAIEKEYGGKIIKERIVRDGQVIVEVSCGPLSNVYNVVFSITNYAVFDEEQS